MNVDVIPVMGTHLKGIEGEVVESVNLVTAKRTAMEEGNVLWKMVKKFASMKQNRI